jgi:hypothetical protein
VEGEQVRTGHLLSEGVPGVRSRLNRPPRDKQVDRLRQEHKQESTDGQQLKKVAPWGGYRRAAA